MHSTCHLSFPACKACGLEAGRGCGGQGAAVHTLGCGGPWVEWSPPQPSPLHLASRVREQLQSIQVQWTRVQERSEQRRRQLLASLRLQVRPAPVPEAPPGGVPRRPRLR